MLRSTCFPLYLLIACNKLMCKPPHVLTLAPQLPPLLLDLEALVLTIYIHIFVAKSVYVIRFFQITNFGLMRLDMLSGRRRNFLNLCMVWPAAMFLNYMPKCAPLFDQLAFLMNSLQLTSNTTSHLWLLIPSCSENGTLSSATWANVWFSPFILCTTLTPSIMQAVGEGMISAELTFSNYP